MLFICTVYCWFSQITVENTINEVQEETSDLGNVEDLLEVSQPEIGSQISEKQVYFKE